MSTWDRSLGQLESGVLAVLWDAPEPLSVREVLTALPRGKALAYTTVLTVLDRLHDKGLVRRQRDGKAFRYRARVSREAWVGERAARVLTSEDAPPTRAVLMAFLDSAEHASPALLAKLSSLLDERKKARKR